MTVTDTAPHDTGAHLVDHPDRQFLRLATVGSVDDGKSTLIGRILHDTGSLPTDHIASVTDDVGELDLAALSDGLQIQWLASTTDGTAADATLATDMVAEIRLYIEGLKERWGVSA